MTVIKQEDLIQSIADSLQYISYYHPLDYIQALGRAYELEEFRPRRMRSRRSSRTAACARKASARSAGHRHRHDLREGRHGRALGRRDDGPHRHDQRRRAPRLHAPDNVLRASIVNPPEGARKNTKDNTPAVIHYEIVPGDKVDAGRGEGRRLGEQVEVRDAEPVRLDRRLGAEDGPDDGRGLVPARHAGDRHRRHRRKGDADGEGIADGADRHPGNHARGPKDWVEELRVELHEKVNALGIGAQGLGGLATVLDVKIMAAPTHAASKPVALIPNCAATRHAHFVLDSPAKLEAPSLDAWPKVNWEPNTETSKRVDLNTLTPEEVASWTPGQTLLLSGKMLTGRDAAHKRIADMLAKGEKLPVDFTNRVILRRPGRSGPTKWSARQARRRPRAWTSSPRRCSRKPASSRWSARPSAARSRSTRSRSTRRPT